MERKIIILIFFLSVSSIYSQINVGDNDFKAYLLEANQDNFRVWDSENNPIVIHDGNGEIDEILAEEVETIIVSGAPLYGGATINYNSIDLSGFANLKNFQFYGIAQEIDLNSNNNLTNLFVFGTDGTGIQEITTAYIERLLIRNESDEQTTTDGTGVFDFNPFNIGEICLDETQLTDVNSFISSFVTEYSSLGGTAATIINNNSCTN